MAEVKVARSDTSSPDTDKDFDPSAEMLVHEYDDERTLDEEEALTSGESCTGELDDLQKESEMPIEALLAQYSAAASSAPSAAPDMEPTENSQSTVSSSEEEILETQNLTLDKEEVARDLLKNVTAEENKEVTVNELIQNVSRSQAERLLRSTSHPESDESSSSSEDENYEPVEEEHKKTIQVGSDFQAHIPVGLQVYGDAPAYENEDRLLWDPSKIKDEAALDEYLCNIQRDVEKKLHAVASIPRGKHIRDDEQALFLLLQCDNNIEEAERRRKMQAVPPTDVMSLWSEDECRNFEDGLRLYGKNFHEIHHNKVRTRSVFELVHFYYLWKKTERHDVFAAKTRAEKRKYTLNPGVLDHMERFLEEQEVELHQLIAPQISQEQLLEEEHLRVNLGLFSTGRTTIMSPTRQVERNPGKSEQPGTPKKSHNHAQHLPYAEDVNGAVPANCQSPKRLQSDNLQTGEPSPKRVRLGSEATAQAQSPSKGKDSSSIPSAATSLSPRLPQGEANTSIESGASGGVSEPKAAGIITPESVASQPTNGKGDSSDHTNKTTSSESTALPTNSPGKVGRAVGIGIAPSLSTDIANGVMKSISADAAAV